MLEELAIGLQHAQIFAARAVPADGTGHEDLSQHIN